MKVLLVISSILAMASATRVYCDLETSSDVASPIGVTVAVNFNCNNDQTHQSETGFFQYVVQTFLPCAGCNDWHGSKHGGYEINPKQNSDKPAGVTFWLKWNGKECNTHRDDSGESFTLSCNV